MTTTVPVEELLQQTLERLAQQERRMEALEASVLGTVPRGMSFRPSIASRTETPTEIAWPTREIPTKPAPPATDRTTELEERLAKAEERVRIAGRLETVGRLVAGVAHDFNNLLTVIAGYADTIHFQLPVGHPLRETADLIASTTQTAAGVTRQLVSFSRPSKPNPCPVDVNLALGAIERTLRRLTSTRVVLDILPPPTPLPLICADPGQFDQVLLNLVVNARDAIPDTGKITIRTIHASVTADRPGWPADVLAGEFVALTVTDTGAGMTEDVLARIFDPFFTTKGDRGTGLGLSTVREIVRAAGGHVEVESAPGWGTSVRVFWPVFADTSR